MEANGKPHISISLVELLTGPMYAEKTLRLIAMLKKFQVMRVPIVCLRPLKDTRDENLCSRSGLSLMDDVSQVQTSDLVAIDRLVRDKTVIGIDEIQMFTPQIVVRIEQWVRQGKHVIAAGIDSDFRGIVFPTIAALMALPETKIHRVKAVCAVCLEENATRSQRLRFGQPVPFDEPVELIDGVEAGVTYEPRCILHHVCPR